MLVRTLALSAALCATAASALAYDLVVATDQSRVIKLDAPANTIIVGNPMIAEVTMVDNQTVAVLGRMMGQTNIIALDKAGNEVHNQNVAVRLNDQQIVTLYKGNVGPRTFSCAPRCEWMIHPGDLDFKEIHENAEKKQDLAEGAAGLSGKPK